jgi:hypothetical protein
MHVRSGTDHDILLYKAVLIPEGDSSTSTVQLRHNAMHYIGGRKTVRRSDLPSFKKLSTRQVSTEMLGHLCRQKALNFNIFVNQGLERLVEGSGG